MITSVPARVQRASSRLCGVLRSGAFCALLAAAFVSPVDAAPEGAFLSRFVAGERLDDGWQVSHFTIRSNGFRTAWVRDAVGWFDDALSLSLVPSPDEAETEFHGAEVQRRLRTHYGRYEVEMTAARGEGVISSFFTYTGPFYGDPQDEIDLEFLGRDTTRVWVTRFAKGAPLPGQWVDLGFDAAEGSHVYAFDWSPEEIVWYADGRELFRVHADDTAIPDIPGRIMFNIWAGGEAQADWSGVAPGDVKARALYRCVSYRPPGSDAPMCSDGDVGG
ncbi:family 16 glycosylhydrolase [Jannaschia sp. S6380]|uniref:family 16 glycosylhydrolase n=1 Tax=Jannaschia sp. S6380 TaxID=2926408 RepID=UPI001FF3B226|nr:family 16 glycosylhydrolase [Jannaschia sp. S6380]MCK0168490.1 family 16 glycosylhydrolase [Jannaschia sp. S6380]